MLLSVAPRRSIIEAMADTPPRSKDDTRRYSAEALAEKHGIPIEQARDMLARARIVLPIEDGEPGA